MRLRISHLCEIYSYMFCVYANMQNAYISCYANTSVAWICVLTCMCAYYAHDMIATHKSTKMVDLWVITRKVPKWRFFVWFAQIERIAQFEHTADRWWSADSHDSHFEKGESCKLPKQPFRRFPPKRHRMAHMWAIRIPGNQGIYRKMQFTVLNCTPVPTTRESAFYTVKRTFPELGYISHKCEMRTRIFCIVCEIRHLHILHICRICKSYILRMRNMAFAIFAACEICKCMLCTNAYCMLRVHVWH